MLDSLTKEGAKQLLATIRNFWTYRGYTVSLEIFEIPGSPGHFGIKSNMINGLPRGRRASMRLAA